MIPYRPLATEDIQLYFDAQAGVGKGLDPPPEAVKLGCLQRAWSRFEERYHILKEACGQILFSGIKTGEELWVAMRQRLASLDQILSFLAHPGKISLLGSYRCLLVAG